MLQMKNFKRYNEHASCMVEAGAIGGSDREAARL
jgi:hypothetical protein